MDLCESLLAEGVPEQPAHPGLDPEDGLVGGGPEVQHTVVQPGVLVYRSGHYFNSFLLTFYNQGPV